MTAYYNEIDPLAAAWLRELINSGVIPGGEVDERSIEDVSQGDLRGFAQCHFFAGIGGWAYALRLAGWPDDRPVWTGSCPCQPFSAAGKGEGFNDTRHLWPAWFRLIRECRPSRLFGEQVASADGLAWFDTVSTDLEAEGYAVGAADLCAAGIGAPHIRQRLYFTGWMADTASAGTVRVVRGEDGTRSSRGVESSSGRSDDHWRDIIWLPCTDGKYRPTKPGIFPLASGVSGRVGHLRGAGNSIVPQVAQAFIEAVEAATTKERT